MPRGIPKVQELEQKIAHLEEKNENLRKRLKEQRASYDKTVETLMTDNEKMKETLAKQEADFRYRYDRLNDTCKSFENYARIRAEAFDLLKLALTKD